MLENLKLKRSKKTNIEALCGITHMRFCFFYYYMVVQFIET